MRQEIDFLVNKPLLRLTACVDARVVLLKNEVEAMVRVCKGHKVVTQCHGVLVTVLDAFQDVQLRLAAARKCSPDHDRWTTRLALGKDLFVVI